MVIGDYRSHTSVINVRPSCEERATPRALLRVVVPHRMVERWWSSTASSVGTPNEVASRCTRQTLRVGPETAKLEADTDGNVFLLGLVNRRPYSCRYWLLFPGSVARLHKESVAVLLRSECCSVAYPHMQVETLGRKSTIWLIYLNLTK